MKISEMKRKAAEAIERRGALLVYPLSNRKEPGSLWSELFPRSHMRWAWDEGGDARVADLWIAREQLSRSRTVVYAKWFQGRATFFSRTVFAHLLAYLGSHQAAQDGLSPDSREVLDLLLNDSPLSTKQLKAAANMEGRLMESTYNQASKPLWNRLLLVGFGEFDDSSFASLGVGATAALFEDLWNESESISPLEAEAFLKRKWGEENPFFRFAKRIGHAELSRPSP